MIFTKVRDVKSPERGTEEAGGIDFFIPNDFNSALPITLKPEMSTAIPSGIKVALRKGLALIAFNKSSMALYDKKKIVTKVTKQGELEYYYYRTPKSTIVGACLIDSDYKGEIHINLINTGREPIVIFPGQKIAQFVLMPIELGALHEVSSEEYHANWADSERGDGAFGSTGDGLMPIATPENIGVAEPSPDYPEYVEPTITDEETLSDLDNNNTAS